MVPRSSVARHRPSTELIRRRYPASLVVVLVSHHALVADAVRMALTSQGIQATVMPCSGTPRALSQVARAVDALRPSAGLMLCDMDDPSQLTKMVALVRAVHIRWLLLTQSEDESRWGAAIEAGVGSVLPMSEGLTEVAGALRLVAEGRSALSEEVRERSLQAWHREGEENRATVVRLGLLTPRERTVLGLLAQGMKVKEIALQSEVTQGTVRSQVKSILRKLGVRSQLAAVAAERRVAVPGPRSGRD